MKNYFENCNTLDQAKSLFRKLCMTMHPDKGGNEQEFIKMFKQWENFKPSVNKESDKNFNAKKFYNLIQLFAGLDGLKISFVGTFIWIEDMEPAENYKLSATYRHKEKLKSIKIDGMKPCFYAKKKKAWYFSPIDYTQKSKAKKSLSQLKNQWGCKSFEAEKITKLSY